MATNHTEHYALNLWQPQDSFLREEFNENTQKIDAALVKHDAAIAGKGNCQIVTGTYTGKGTVGYNNPIALNFDKPPLFIILMGNEYRMTLVRGAKLACATMPSGGYQNIVTWSENSVSFYMSGSLPEGQMNTKNVTYYYVAFLQQ